MEFLGGRRPTRASELRDSVERPTCRPVRDALPQWDATPLHQKIPMFHGHGPNGPVALSRGRVGSDPLRPANGVQMDFALDDPHGREVSNAYDALHDPHLKGWFGSARNRKILRKHGLVTDDDRVVCDLRRYNEYRRSLWRRHRDGIAEKLRERDELNDQRNRIFLANERFKRERDRKIRSLKAVDKKEREIVRKKVSIYRRSRGSINLVEYISTRLNVYRAKKRI